MNELAELLAVELVKHPDGMLAVDAARAVRARTADVLETLKNDRRFVSRSRGATRSDSARLWTARMLPAETRGNGSAGVVTLDEAKRLIALAIANGHAETLHEVRAKASAHELFNARTGAMATANDAGEIKVRAERGLALLDVQAAPHGVTVSGGRNSDAPLASLHTSTRAAIRKLAALDEDEFERRLEVARDDQVAGVSTRRVLAASDRLTGYSSATDLWSTPQDLFEELHREFGFTLDVCATAGNAKCARFFTEDDDGLAQEWKGVCWMNPPYGDAIARWVAKAHASSLAGTVVVCLVPARTDTGWFWDYCLKGEVRLLRGRLKFGGGDTSAPSCVVVFPVREPRVIPWERGQLERQAA